MDKDMVDVYGLGCARGVLGMALMQYAEAKSVVMRIEDLK